MKNLKNKKLTEFNMNLVYGGKVYNTQNDEGNCDVWDDADDDGKLSKGDTYCLVSCEE